MRKGNNCPKRKEISLFGNGHYDVRRQCCKSELILYQFGIPKLEEFLII